MGLLIIPIIMYNNILILLYLWVEGRIINIEKSGMFISGCKQTTIDSLM